ncbi:Tubulin-tyrosine ligase/Tubulin polyglutamylase [Trinorchestia longiramus]|nr:Tubulin-tyrosine ligase/Tubulin polyglutamylase [Trinorchestia longiramus]
MPNAIDKVSLSVSELCPIRDIHLAPTTCFPEVHHMSSEIKCYSQSSHRRQDFSKDKLRRDYSLYNNYHGMNTRLTARLSGGQTPELQLGLTNRENINKGKEKVHTRPSYAVQRRVKKISEDFTIAHMNFKSSHKSNSIMINLDRPQLLSPKFPRGLSSTKYVCSKCENFSSKSDVLPLLSINEDQTCSDRTTCSDLTQEDSLKQDGGSVKKPVVDAHTPSACTNSSIFHEETNSQVYEENSGSSNFHRLDVSENKSHHCSRAIGKKRCFSASTSPRPQCVTLVQLKRARQFTERAIKEGRVFSIYGHFPAVRQALKSRGWVEKVLQRTPYVNPHPANCVCFQPNCTSAMILNSPTAAATPGDHTQKVSVVTGRSQFNFIERNRKLCKLFRNKQVALEEEEEEEEEEEILQKNEDSLIEDINEEESCDTINETEGIVSEHLDDESSQTYTAFKEEPDSLEKSDDKKECRFKFNPSTLCPLEIRYGIDKCINENNESLYKYTVPVYSPIKITKQCPVQPIKEEQECPSLERLSPVPTVADVREEKLRDCHFEVESPQRQAPNKYLKEAAKASEHEEAYNPLDPYPDLGFSINDVDPSLVGRLLNNVEPNLIWTWTRDTVSYKHLTRDQLVNRFPNTIFTTKHGLCSTMQQLHWFSEAPCAETFVPRGYCIGQAEERAAFQQDYRLTACLGLLGWLSESYAVGGYSAVASSGGEVALRRVWLAVAQVQEFVDSCSHDHLDSPLKTPLQDQEWEAIVSAHNRTVHRNCKLKATPKQLEVVVQEGIAALRRARQHWPQLGIDGVRNTWIVKPGAQSRGRGILLMHSLADILGLVQSPFIYETKYVVQKYMERPFLVYNTKFDIRQWFLVTDWNPLTVWMYRSSYVRFCSQQYDMSRTDEAVHLSNNAIQCKYANGRRHPRLPQENMWDSNTFEAFLEESGWEGAWRETVYPGMKDALVAAMLATQVQMDSFKSGFELFGADFMLSEDLKPWLIEINSSPCMAPTSSVTRRLCAQCLQDIIKVVVDQRACRYANTGEFELIHRDPHKVQTSQPYQGVNLQIIGKQIPRHPALEKPKRLSPPKTIQPTIKPLRLVRLSVASSTSCDSGRVHELSLTHEEVMSSLCRLRRS